MCHRESEQKLLGGTSSSGSDPDLANRGTEEEEQEQEEDGSQQDAASHVNPAVSSENLADNLAQVRQITWPNLHLLMVAEQEYPKNVVSDTVLHMVSNAVYMTKLRIAQEHSVNFASEKHWCRLRYAK